MKTHACPILLAGLLALPLSAAGASAEQFFAEEGAGGSISVVDSAGLPVPIVYGNPVGSRPGICPTGSYYFTEMDTDRAQLVLTDCATGQGNYPVSIVGSN